MDDGRIVELYWRRDAAAVEATDEKYDAYCRALALRSLVRNPDADDETVTAPGPWELTFALEGEAEEPVAFGGASFTVRDSAVSDGSLVPRETPVELADIRLPSTGLYFTQLAGDVPAGPYSVQAILDDGTRVGIWTGGSIPREDGAFVLSDVSVS